MKDKKLKKLMNEYASLPRTDMEEDLAKRPDRGDVVVGPANDPSRNHPVRTWWTRVAVGAAFALVAAVAIPVAVTLAPRDADKAAIGGNYSSESANHADASVREDEGGQAGSIDPGVQGAGSISYEDSAQSANVDEIKIINAELYRPYYDGTYEQARYKSALSPRVLPIAEGIRYSVTDVESDQGDVQIVSPAAAIGGESEDASPFRTFEVVVYLDYQGPLYRNASLGETATWREIAIEYEAGDSIELRFVVDEVYYYVKLVPTDTETDVVALLNSLFA